MIGTGPSICTGLRCGSGNLGYCQPRNKVVTWTTVSHCRPLNGLDSIIGGIYCLYSSRSPKPASSGSGVLAVADPWKNPGPVYRGKQGTSCLLDQPVPIVVAVVQSDTTSSKCVHLKFRPSERVCCVALRQVCCAGWLQKPAASLLKLSSKFDHVCTIHRSYYNEVGSTRLAYTSKGHAQANAV